MAKNKHKSTIHKISTAFRIIAYAIFSSSICNVVSLISVYELSTIWRKPMLL